MTVILEQSHSVQSVWDASLVNVNPPKGKVAMTIWGDKYQLKNTIGPFMGWTTGLKVPSKQYQISTWPWFPGATGMQAYQNEIGISIHSWSIKKNLHDNNLGTIVLAGDPPAKIKPFTNSSKITIEFDFKVPTSRAYGGGVTQIVSYISLHDTTIKSSFWYGISLFDNRGSHNQDQAQWDIGTSMPMVIGYGGSQTKLLDDSSVSSFHSNRFSNYQPVKLVIGEKQLQHAIGMLNAYSPQKQFSTNPHDYILGGSVLNPEIYVPSGLLTYAHIGLAVRNWKTSLATRG
jgi:hypothetical protein